MAYTSSGATLVKRTRAEVGLTQAELARRLDVSQPVIARLERRGANPRLGTLERVLAAMGRSLELKAGPESGIDESMIAADLRLTPEKRLRHFESFYGFARSAGGAALPGSSNGP